MNTSFLQELMVSVAEQGRALLPQALWGGQQPDITALCDALLSGRGEASGVAIAREVLSHYRALDREERRAFFHHITSSMKPDAEAVQKAAADYIADPGDTSLQRLRDVAESPRQEFFRRLNLAPGGTAEIVAMRRDLLGELKDHPEFAATDHDLRHLLASWFNRGFLVLKRIDWQTPAAILEKIIAYEAVHAVDGWEDLRRRLEPADRRCFAFFHPALVDEPLIFVEVLLGRDIPGSIQQVLEQPTPASNDGRGTPPTVAAFYSISNCQEGLTGISFGSFLIKQVVEELVGEISSLKTFVTLSPVPRFRQWLDQILADDGADLVTRDDRIALQVLADPGWFDETSGDESDDEDGVKPILMALAGSYFLQAKRSSGRPYDPVSRFHLGNGAALERVNWRGDISAKGLAESYGLMVNYRYDLKVIEANHEAYTNDFVIAASKSVRALAPSANRAVENSAVNAAVPGSMAGEQAGSANAGGGPAADSKRDAAPRAGSAVTDK